MKCADVRPWPAVGRWADCNPCYLCLKTGTSSSQCKKVIYRFKCVSTAYCSFSTPYWRWQWSDHGVSSSLIASWGPNSTDIKTLFSELSYMRRGRLSFCVICIDFFFFLFDALNFCFWTHFSQPWRTEMISWGRGIWGPGSLPKHLLLTSFTH